MGNNKDVLAVYGNYMQYPGITVNIWELWEVVSKTCYATLQY